MPSSTERHETRALLRAHLAAASGYRHLTPHCPICHRLLRLAMEPLTAPQPPYAPWESGNAADRTRAPEAAAGASGRGVDDEAGEERPVEHSAVRVPDRPPDRPRGCPQGESPPAA